MIRAHSAKNIQKAPKKMRGKALLREKSSKILQVEGAIDGT